MESILLCVKCSPFGESWMNLLLVGCSERPMAKSPKPKVVEGSVDDDERSESSVKLLAKWAIEAQTSKQQSKEDYQFWYNRLRLLRRETEEAERRLVSGSRFEFENASVETAIRSQLADERTRNETIRRERWNAIKIHKSAHLKAIREAQQASLSAKRQISVQRREESEAALKFLEQQRQQELERRHSLKVAVQQEKVVQMLCRARERSMRAEETRRQYEQRILHIEEEEKRQRDATAILVQESSRLVQRMRQLRENV